MMVDSEHTVICLQQGRYDYQFCLQSQNSKYAKIRSKVSSWDHVTHFWNFGTLAISRERLKLETSHLARRLFTKSINDKMQN